MTPEQFAYWLQGFAELSPGAPPTAEQWQSIKDHLGTVFDKRTNPLPSLISAKFPARLYHTGPSDGTIC